MAQFRLMSFSTNLYNLKSDVFYLNREECEQLLLEMKSWPETKESFILSLPERTEILYYSEIDLEDKIFEAIIACKTGGDLPIKSEFNQTSDAEKLFVHLSELCFGVQASHYGNTPLFPQFSQAYNLASKNDQIGEYLEKWWGNILTTNNLLKEQVDYQLPNFSISFIVSDLLSEMVNKLKATKIAIIGFNALSKRIYRNLCSQGYSEITIVDQSIASCSTLEGAELNSFSFEPIDQVRKVIRENDILISTLEDTTQLLPHQYLQHGFQTPKVFIDLSIKNGLTSILSEYNQVISFNLTDIYKIIEQKMEINKKWLREAKPIVMGNNKNFFEWMDNKTAQRMLDILQKHLKESINCNQFSGVMTSDEPVFYYELASNKINESVLKKSIAKIKRNARYKDIINYNKIVNDFYQYN